MANRTTQTIDRDRVISGLVDNNYELINDVIRLQDALLEAQRTNVVLREMITELLDRPIALCDLVQRRMAMARRAEAAEVRRLALAAAVRS